MPNTDEEIKYLCDRYGIENYTINEDMSIDINDNLNLDGFCLDKMPLKINNINGNFRCRLNNLTRLEGFPKTIHGSFNCTNNNIYSLEGMPIILGRGFDSKIYATNNNIKSFKGIDDDFDGRLYCYNNPIWVVFRLFYEDSSCISLINEYDVIQGDNIIMDRLEEVFYMLNMNIPDIDFLSNYNLGNYSLVY